MSKQKLEEETESVLFSGMAYDGVVIAMKITCKPADKEAVMQRIQARLPLTSSVDILRYPELLYRPGH